MRTALILFAVLSGLAGCAAGPGSTRLAALDVEPAPEPDPVPPPFEMSAQTRFGTCIEIALLAEDLSAYTGRDGEVPPVQRHDLVAEYPVTPEEMETGLKGRHDLHPKTAMLFPFPGDHNPVLWMKDTPSSLDMVFFDATGAAIYMESHTTPGSTQFLSPEEPEPVATHVLELPAGRAEELGLFPGFARMQIGLEAPCTSFSKALTGTVSG